MATFLTPLKKNKMTAGERRFAELLQKHLDDEYLVWYNTASLGKTRRYPDFLIFHPRYGLWCLEIKDWYMGNIKGMTKENIRLRVSETEEINNAVHPIEQARTSCLPFVDRMKKDRYLRHAHGQYQGKLLFPWGYGAVMSNWQRDKIREEAREQLENCFPPALTWYKEDLIEGGLTQDAFLSKLHDMLPYHFPVALDTAQIQRIRAHIYPEFIIGKQSTLFEKQSEYPDIVKVMDIRQEQVARDLGGGHRVIHGVAGSGKTLILQHRARKLAEETQGKPVLIICYNIMLASILKSRLEDNPRIEIYHFHDWCGKLKKAYGLSIPYGDYYPDRLADAVCRAVEDDTIPSGQYHGVLIDEGHDLTADWLRTLTRMPDPDENHLLLLYDGAQTLYPGRNVSLSSVGVMARGRTRILRTNYRNSEEIHRYANRFIHHFLSDTPLPDEQNAIFDLDEKEESNDTDIIPVVGSESSGGQTGILPEMRLCTDRTQEINIIISKIKNWHKDGAAWGDIAVLYYSKKQGIELANKLRSAGIPLENPVTTEERTAYRPTPDTLLLCTIHSSKGGEFPRVIVSGINTLPDIDEEQQQTSARLLYVGFTRAQTHLCVTAARENTFTRLLS